MEQLFTAIKAIVSSSISHDWLGLGASIVDTVAASLGIAGSVAYWALRALGLV
ncbi:beta-class phenol-soluble modulin [Mycetocola sp. JXN-3]|uniref:beta-class phenol-soluble modulin n=1 Tax=Mycetocola sp. JXN-3 TaxID=2116510 RepID=UPI00165D1B1B|nr:beta-class phenol-soluble modulin [Mycetocola sp. JXN-3]